MSLKPCADKVTKKSSTAKDAWEALQREYESTALVLIVGLYASLFRTRFDKFTSMDQYVDHFPSITDQLESVGQPFADYVIGGILLGGLPD